MLVPAKAKLSAGMYVYEYTSDIHRAPDYKIIKHSRITVIRTVLYFIEQSFLKLECSGFSPKNFSKTIAGKIV